MDCNGDSFSRCMWRPDASRETNATRFRKRINEKFSLNLENYQDLYGWTVENYSEFWEEVWHVTKVKHSKPYDEVIDTKKSISDIPKWFIGTRLNFAENLMKYDDDRPAIFSAAEASPKDGNTYERLHKVEGSTSIQKRTFAEMRQDVTAFAAAMRKMGVKTGDRVVGYLPNCAEAVYGMLAAASIGAIWSTTSPDFGVTGVLDRFTQIQPKLIFSVNAVVYNGKVHNHMDKLEQVVNGLPDLESVVVIPYVTTNRKRIDLNKIKHGIILDDFLSSGKNEDGKYPELKFEQLPFDHPLYIMYSSGTTGPPKCMVHSAGGTLMKHLEEHILQGGMTRNDVILYYTTTGWMMWNWFVSALAAGAAIVCYDGSPLVPSPNVLWDLIDEIGITVLGTGAKWLAVLEEKGIKPRETHSLQSLHTILSTGSPLKPLSFDYVYRDIKSDVLLGSITGGTDIIGCFAGHSTDLPVYRGEIQGRLLGMAMESWDEEGKPVRGVSGELVCTKPFPSMPTHFWRDEDGLKYKRAYFDRYPGIWTHGDFCLISAETGGTWMLGRSDGTLNPAGVRFGSAEIYHVVEAFKEIQDSLCVSQRSKDLTEERVVLFLQMAPGSEFNTDLVKKVRTDIRLQLSARHVPSLILETKAIPYTQSGKKVEVAVKKILAGEEVTQRGAYTNPGSLDHYANLPELVGF